MQLQCATMINTNLLDGLRGPDFLQATIPPLRVFRGVEFGDGRDVRLELLGKDGGELLRGRVGFIHDGRCGVRVSIIGHDVPRRHPLEIHEVMRLGHGESPQDTEAEGALGVFGNPAA